jgi:hypothetical protein
MSSSDTTATDKRDVYARVTAQIVNGVEEGVGTWRMQARCSQSDHRDGAQVGQIDLRND